MFSRNLQKFKLITFDCTNTLLFFKHPVNYQYLKMAVEMGHKKEDFDEDKIIPSFRKHFKEMKEKNPNFGRESIGFHSWWRILVQNVLSDAYLNSNKNPQDFENVADKLIRQYETKECWEKYEGCDELIKSLKHHGKLIGIISNFDPRLHYLLRDVHLYKQFDFIISSYECKIEKPDYKIFQLALDRSLGISWDMIYPNEALHIGNELDLDYEAAKNAGWTSVLISKDNVNCENRFESLKQFYEAINKDEINL